MPHQARLSGLASRHRNSLVSTAGQKTTENGGHISTASHYLSDNLRERK